MYPTFRYVWYHYQGLKYTILIYDKIYKKNNKKKLIFIVMNKIKQM